MSIRVVIGSSNDKLIKQLGVFLQTNGFHLVGESNSGHELLRKVHTVYPDLVILDYRLRGMNGHEVSEILIDEGVCPVMALISSGEVSSFINLSQEPTFVPLVKPCSRDTLLNTVHLLVKTAKSIGALEKELKEVKGTKNSKSLVTQAKKLLMEHMDLSEDDAHRRIQKQSMDKGISKVKIAEAVILMYGQ